LVKSVLSNTFTLLLQAGKTETERRDDAKS